jgi:hypothetical protein
MHELLVLKGWWMISARRLSPLELAHLIHFLINDHLIPLLSYVSRVLASVPEAALPQLLELAESLPEAALVSVEHALVSSFLVDAAKSSETPGLILMDVSVPLVLQLQLCDDPLNDVAVESVDLDFRFLTHVLVWNIHAMELRLIAVILV